MAIFCEFPESMDSFIQGQVIDNRFLHEIANEASRRKGFKGRTIGKVVKGGDQIKKTNSCMGKKSTLPTISYHKRGKKSRHYPPFPLQKYPAQPMAKKKKPWCKFWGHRSSKGVKSKQS